MLMHLCTFHSPCLSPSFDHLAHHPSYDIANATSRDSRIPEARKALEQSARQNGMDWPEAIWEAWLALEHAYGTVQTLQSCLDSVERGRMLVGAKRARVGFFFAFSPLSISPSGWVGLTEMGM